MEKNTPSDSGEDVESLAARLTEIVSGNGNPTGDGPLTTDN